jgi:hypothetical protein
MLRLKDTPLFIMKTMVLSLISYVTIWRRHVFSLNSINKGKISIAIIVN